LTGAFIQVKHTHTHSAVGANSPRSRVWVG